MPQKCVMHPQNQVGIMSYTSNMEVKATYLVIASINQMTTGNSPDQLQGTSSATDLKIQVILTIFSIKIEELSTGKV